MRTATKTGNTEMRTFKVGHIMRKNENWKHKENIGNLAHKEE
jgi:hypothetical protein